MITLPGVPSEAYCSHCTTLIEKVLLEVLRAQQLFPPFNSGHEGHAIIREELDELWEAVKLKQSTVGRDDKMQKEATQVAAMAIRFLIEQEGFKK